MYIEDWLLGANKKPPKEWMALKIKWGNNLNLKWQNSGISILEIVVIGQREELE